MKLLSILTACVKDWFSSHYCTKEISLLELNLYLWIVTPCTNVVHKATGFELMFRHDWTCKVLKDFPGADDFSWESSASC